MFVGNIGSRVMALPLLRSPLMASIPISAGVSPPPPESPCLAIPIESPPDPASAPLRPDFGEPLLTPQGDPVLPPAGETESSAQRLPGGRAKGDDASCGSMATMTRALESLPLAAAGAGGGTGRFGCTLP